VSFVHRRRVASVTASALLALMLIGPAAVNAGTPGWKFYITPIPADGIVAPSASAGFVVTIANEGKSNISALYLSTDLPATAPNGGAPTYVGTPGWTNQPDGSGVCSAANAGPLYCDLGNLIAGASVTVTVAFQMPASGSSFFNFLAFGNGNTPSDGGTSHGDELKGLISINSGNSRPPVTPAAQITLNASKNFAGGFTTDGTVVANDQTLGPKNIQSGKIVPPAQNVPVTIEDGLADDAFSCANLGTTCTNRFGEWARLNVAAGTPFNTGIHVTYTILGNKVPQGATVDTINLIHVPSDGAGNLGTPYVIYLRCGAATLPSVPGVECITVTQVGKNFQVDAWFASNGGSRTAY
jgi:hypothetical protein